METLRIIAALSLAILLGPAAHGQSLSGRVVDGKGQTPVAGA